LQGLVEVTECQTSWRKGQNFFGINLAFYKAHTDMFKVGSGIKVCDNWYFIDAMNVPNNCNKGVALVYVANKRECVDGTPWVHTSQCGFGGTLLKTVEAGDSWGIGYNPPVELLHGRAEVTECQPSWRKGQNFFGINLAFYKAHTDLFKVGSGIKVGDNWYFIDAMNVPNNCNKGVALVYVANKRECVDGTPWVHTSECGFGGTLLKTVEAGDVWEIQLIPVAGAADDLAHTTRLVLV